MPAPLADHVAKEFRKQRLEGRNGVVAISGGADSVALAHICFLLQRERRLAKFTLAHLNHQLRGAASDADEAFVVKLAEIWGLTVRTHRVHIPQLAAGANLESTARAARYAWLGEVARQVGAAWIATGHTADDQAETVLHHFLRGSGLAGLGGMAATRSLAADLVVVRPLLALRRHELIEHLHAHGIDHRHDTSNDDRSFTRNRLRHELLPMLVREYNPALIDVLCRTATQMREAHGELRRQAEALLEQAELPRAGTMIVLRAAALQQAAQVLVREMFRVMWQREGWPMGEMDFAAWDRLATHVGGGDFPGGVHVRCVGQVLQLERRTP